MKQEDEPPKKRMRFTDSFVTLKVGTGSDIETFSAHENVLKEHSEFFRIAFDKKWKRGQPRKIEQPDDEPETVNLFLEWLYNKESLATTLVSGDPGKHQETYTKLYKLYVFGEKIQMSQLCNDVIVASLKYSSLRDKQGINHLPGIGDANIIYDGTTSTSPARKLMVYMLVNFATSKWFGNGSANAHPELVKDLLMGFVEGRKAAVFSDLYPQRETWFKK